MKVGRMIGIALMPLAAACAQGMNGAMMSPSGQADAQAHAILSASDAGEIQTSQVATGRAQSQAVRAFAQRMITDHSNALAVREQRLGSMGMGLRASTMAMGGTMSAGSGSGTGTFTSAMVLTPAGMTDLNAVLMANPASRPLAQTAMGDVQRLQQMSGMQLDQAYMTRQVEMHQYTLATMDRILAQNAVSADTRALMVTQRAAVAMHLQMAQQIRASMM